MTRLSGLAVALLVFVAPSCRPTPSGSDVPQPPVTEATQTAVARALTSARQAVVEAPDDAAAWGRYGILLDAHDMYPQAEVCYRNASRLDPGEFRWLYHHALVGDFLGADTAVVRERFDRAIAHSPEFPPLYFRYGEALLRRGEIEDAVEAYRRVTVLDDDLAVAHRALGNALLSSGDLDGALRHLRRAESLDPNDGATYAALAQAYARSGDMADAEAATLRASVLQRNTRLPDPLRYAVEQEALDSGSLTKRYKRAMHERDWAGAMEALGILVEAFPQNATLLNDLATCNVAVGNLEAARRYIERAVEAAPERTDARFRLAILLFRAEEYEASARHLEHVVAAEPDSIPMRYQLAVTLERLGLLEAAKTHYREVLARDPSHDAANRLASLR